MNSTIDSKIRNAVLTMAFIGCCLSLLYIGFNHIILNPTLENTIQKEVIVQRVYEAGVKDIVLEEADGDFYYINRGLEQDLTLEGIEKRVLHKKVTLRLAKVLSGATNHIAQLKIDNEIVYSEF